MAMNMIATSPIPADSWHTESTAHSIALHIAAGCRADSRAVYHFSLLPEQARRLIRDLSAAVLESDLQRLR
jgi:hypothetical protein